MIKELYVLCAPFFFCISPFYLSIDDTFFQSMHEEILQDEEGDRVLQEGYDTLQRGEALFRFSLAPFVE